MQYISSKYNGHTDPKTLHHIVAYSRRHYLGSGTGKAHCAHTTQQSLAMTDIQEMQHSFSAEIIEAYEYEMVDEPPMFPGGNNALVQFINSSRRYPAKAYENRIHGRVLCSFIVQPDGEITHVNVLRGVEPSLDREAVRILGSMPNWKAGRIDGNKVPVYCILPVIFRL